MAFQRLSEDSQWENTYLETNGVQETVLSALVERVCGSESRDRPLPPWAGRGRPDLNLDRRLTLHPIPSTSLLCLPSGGCGQVTFPLCTSLEFFICNAGGS